MSRRPPRYLGAMLLAALCFSGVTHVEAVEPGWDRHTIWSGPSGADGVDLADVNGDGWLDIASGWEQSGTVTVSLNPGPDAAAAAPWQTVAVGPKLTGVEDAIFADVDEDGRVDVISACECRKITVHFAPEPERILDPTAWHSVLLTESIPANRWIKIATADIDADGHVDIVAGGKVGRPSTVGWFRAPEDRRDGAAWAYTPISEVGWTMSLIPRDADGDQDVDVVLSDREMIIHADGTRRFDLRGSRWLENTGTAWLNHPIATTKQDMKFIHLTDFDQDGDEDVLDGVSAAAYNQTFLRRNLGDWLAWETVFIPQPGGVGQYQDVKAADMNLDGATDLVFSYAAADADLSGVVMLAGAPDQQWQRVEVSGPDGTKYDNVELLDLDGDTDLDIITSEQVDQLGLIWYENPERRTTDGPT